MRHVGFFAVSPDMGAYPNLKEKHAKITITQRRSDVST